MKALIFFVMLASMAYGQKSPHYVKTITFSSDGSTLLQIKAVERSVAWLLKRSPDYWIRLESFYCDADVENKDDPKDKLIQKAITRAKTVKRELVSRTIDETKIEVIGLGKAEDPSKCFVRLVAGPSSNMVTPGPDKEKK